MLKKYYTAEDFVRDNDLILSGARILNAGSSTTRFGQNCMNVDIQQKANVDLVADLHCLPDNIGKFDAVVCNAVLQYCRPRGNCRSGKRADCSTKHMIASVVVE